MRWSRKKVTVSPSPEPSRASDKMLAVAGITLAAASAVFPWYVFLNADKFGLTSDTASLTRDLPPLPGRQVFSVSPMAMVDRTRDDMLLGDPIDRITTATVSSIGAERDGAPVTEQPMPGKGDFRLLHVANGRAMIEDAAGMYMVRIGSILPDNSKVATLEQRNGKWVVITSTGDIYHEQAANGR